MYGFLPLPESTALIEHAALYSILDCECVTWRIMGNSDLLNLEHRRRLIHMRGSFERCGLISLCGTLKCNEAFTIAYNNADIYMDNCPAILLAWRQWCY